MVHPKPEEQNMYFKFNNDQWAYIKGRVVADQNPKVIEALNAMLDPQKKFLFYGKWEIKLEKTSNSKGDITGMRAVIPMDLVYSAYVSTLEVNGDIQKIKKANTITKTALIGKAVLNWISKFLS